MPADSVMDVKKRKISQDEKKVHLGTLSLLNSKDPDQPESEQQNPDLYKNGLGLQN
jgi:hypothetical protein